MLAAADMHTHSSFSFDADYDPAQMLDGAARQGLKQICFTDHVDFYDPSDIHLPDFSARHMRLAELRSQFPQLTIWEGAEISMATDASCARNAVAALNGAELDLIIGSVHTIGPENVWEDSFYASRTREAAYRLYLETILQALDSLPQLDVLGHYDFVAHYAPYGDRAMHYTDAPDVFDGIFHWLVARGKTLEINTSAWESDQPWGLDILRRFRELGGRFVTIGSDSHNPRNLGRRFAEAAALAQQAGLAVAYYRRHEPQIFQL